jgi:NAD(P)-dependent dehydrogenase (short-subunit alcohol dehydrogenase family)
MKQVHGRPMAGRTVLVTGGPGGIGRATALGLATMGAHLAITCRDRERAEGAAREIRAAGGGRVDLFVADLSSQSEVRRLAGEVLQTYPRIDVLVNDVGGYWNTRHVTVDELEHTFALNHLAPFLPGHRSPAERSRTAHEAPRSHLVCCSHGRGQIVRSLVQWTRARRPAWRRALWTPV